MPVLSVFSTLLLVGGAASVTWCWFTRCASMHWAALTLILLKSSARPRLGGGRYRDMLRSPTTRSHSSFGNFRCLCQYIECRVLSDQEAKHPRCRSQRRVLIQSLNSYIMCDFACRDREPKTGVSTLSRLLYYPEVLLSTPTERRHPDNHDSESRQHFICAQRLRKSYNPTKPPAFRRP